MAAKKKSATIAPAVGGLDTRAMKVGLHIGYWEGHKKDTQVIAEVTRDNNAEKDAGFWWTRIIPKSAIQPIKVARWQARTVWQSVTLPWSDDGYRILPAAMYFVFTELMRKEQAKYQDAVDKFLAEYPTLLADASKRLGDLYNPDHYPTQRELSASFPFEVTFAPIPMANDFRVDLGNGNTDKIRKEIEDRTAKDMQTSMRDLWDRLYNGVEKIVEKMSDPKAIFRDSLIENIAELCEILPKMNITGDANLEACRKAVLEKIANKDPDTLRENDTARASAGDAAKKILEQMKGFLGGN